MTKPIEIIVDQFPELVIYDGFDDAIIGVGSVNQQQAVVYDEAMVIEIIQRDLEIDEVSAVEYFEFNVSGAYIGEKTPIFFVPAKDLK